jgi:PIN domain nuclease of toxin-antitoxin system
MIYIVDTHALVWFLEGDDRLSIAARKALEDAAAQVVVPSIVLAEIAFLYDRHRITIDVPEVLAHIGNTPNCIVYPLDEALVSYFPAKLNIHDAIIVGTALLFRDLVDGSVSLVTKDGEVSRSGLVDVVW